MAQTVLHLTSRPPNVTKGQHAHAGHLLTVDEARDLVALSRRRPWQGDSTVVHIRDAQRVRDDVWNALLKVLEEPPPYVHFHLYAPSTDSIPNTIKSRSHVVRESLPRQSTEDVSRLVRYIENGGALAIIREGDRHDDRGETRRSLMALQDYGVAHGDMDIANLSEYYLTFLAKGVSAKVVTKCVLLQLAIRRKQRVRQQS